MAFHLLFYFSSPFVATDAGVTDKGEYNGHASSSLLGYCVMVFGVI